jgi:hypothetical protein
MFDRALGLHRRAGHRRFEAIALSDLGVLALERGQSARAVRLCEQAARRLDALGAVELATLAHSFSALARAQCGEPVELAVRHVLNRQRVGAEETLAAALYSAAEVNVEIAQWIANQRVECCAQRLWGTLPVEDEESLVWNSKITAHAKFCDEVRLARRLAVTLHEWHTASLGVLAIDRRCTRCRMPSGSTIDLSDKPVLAALLKALVWHRLDGRKDPLLQKELLTAAWSDERMSQSAAKNRLHVALSKLRKSGLEGALVSSKGSYRLAQTLPTLVMSSD